jgi:hypothetical protein
MSVFGGKADVDHASTPRQLLTQRRNRATDQLAPKADPQSRPASRRLAEKASDDAQQLEGAVGLAHVVVVARAAKCFLWHSLAVGAIGLAECFGELEYRQSTDQRANDGHD